MQTQSPFDAMAETYDFEFTASHVGQLQRQRVWTPLSALLCLYNRPLDILEINCGTGEDAWQLARLGHRVIATDASGKMIERARQKAGLPGQGRMQPQFMVCAFNQLREQFKKQQFDLVISNFGGLNCASGDELLRLSAVLSSLLAAGGRLFLVLMGNFCVWETLYFVSKTKFKTAFRRQQKHTMYGVNGHTIPVFYYSPGKLKKLFYPFFTCTATHPVGLLIPPSYLEKSFLNHLNWLKKLYIWENNWGYPVFSSMADHYCIIFKKKEVLK